MGKGQVYAISASISSNESIAISWLRGIGAVLIVICHIFQGLDDNLCLLFNVGVQMFFFISGFLFGKKDVINVYSWLIRRAKRVMVPYYVLITVVLIICLCIKADSLGVGYLSYYFGIQGFAVLGGGRITGLNHLWFITIIITCYLLTPFLQWIDKKYPGIFVIVLLGCLVCRFLPFLDLANWIFCYVVGYILARRNWIYRAIVIWISIISCLMLVLLYSEDLFIYYSHYYLAWHYIVGISTCVLTLKMFDAIKMPVKLPRFMKALDDYSYEIFLINLIPLVGEFSLIHYGPSLYVNVLLIICLIISAAIFLKYTSNTVLRVIKNNKK